MKRGFALLTVLSLVLICAAPAGAQDISSWQGAAGRYLTAPWPGNFKEGAAVVRSARDGEQARLYREPSAESEILLLYYDGVQAELDGGAADGWNHVRVGTMDGYMQSADLAFDKDSLPKSTIPQIVIDPGDPTGTRARTVPTAPLREAPNASAKTMASYAKGVSALLLGYCGGWCQIYVNDKIGFMQTKYLFANPAPDTGSYSYDGGSSGEEYYVDPYIDPWGDDYEDVVPESGGLDPDWWNYYTAPVYYDVGVWTVSDVRYNAAVFNPDPRDHLNLRDEPDELAPSLGKYYNGARVIVNYVEEDYGWACVTIGSLTGFMKTDYLEMRSPYYYPASAMPVMFLYYSGGSGTYLLDTPSYASRTLGQYLNGTLVTVMGYSDGWVHVIINGQIGFLPTAYVTSEYSPSPVPETFSWNGPTGTHSVAEWPLGVTSFVVNNPDPKDRLNLRTSPSTTAGSKGKYYNGVQVTPLEFLGTGWIKVSIGSQTGYMDSKFISTGYVASAMPVLTTTSQVNFRSAMSTSSKALASLSKGTQVILMGFTSQWAHVIVNGQMGFIYAKYLK